MIAALIIKISVTPNALLGTIWSAPRDGYLVAKMGLELQPLSVSSICGSGGRTSIWNRWIHKDVDLK